MRLLAEVRTALLRHGFLLGRGRQYPMLPFTVLSQALHDLRALLSSPISDKSFNRCLTTLKVRMENEGLTFVQAILSKLADSLLNWAETHTLKPVPGIAFRQGLPLFLGWAFKDVLTSPDNNPALFAALHQLLVLHKRIEGPTRKSDAVCWEEFVARAKANATPIPMDPLVNHLITKAVGRMRFNPRPTHGPGALLERVKGDEKWATWKIPSKLQDLFPPENWLGAGIGASMPGILVETSEQPVTTGAIVFVPKDYKGKRVIAMSQQYEMYVGQSFRRDLYDQILQNPWTKNNVMLTDDSIHRELCGNVAFATIDLSNASDTVRTWHVEEAFHGTALLPILLALRAGKYECTFDGSTHTLQEPTTFAPMGNPLTFPVQGLLYWAICSSVVHRISGIKPRAAAKLVWTFGDDIVVPVWAAEACLHELLRLGFSPNMEKSYYRGEFRESCGYYSFKGYGYEVGRPRSGVPSTIPSLKEVYASDNKWIAAWIDALAKIIELPLLSKGILEYIERYARGRIPCLHTKGEDFLTAPWWIRQDDHPADWANTRWSGDDGSTYEAVRTLLFVVGSRFLSSGPEDLVQDEFDTDPFLGSGTENYQRPQYELLCLKGLSTTSTVSLFGYGRLLKNLALGTGSGDDQWSFGKDRPLMLRRKFFSY